MGEALIISHGSSLVPELEDRLNERGIPYGTVDYRGLRGVRADAFGAIFSTGGNTPIRGNPDLGEEIRLFRECEAGASKLMALCHGAQIGAVQSGGKISELAEPRQGYAFLDYLAVEDPILHGIPIEEDAFPELKILEWHSWGIDTVGPDYRQIMLDGKGKIQIARHKVSPVYLMQPHPEARRPKQGQQETNGEIILDNFLGM